MFAYLFASQTNIGTVSKAIKGWEKWETANAGTDSQSAEAITRRNEKSTPSSNLHRSGVAGELSGPSLSLSLSLDEVLPLRPLKP